MPRLVVCLALLAFTLAPLAPTRRGGDRATVHVRPASVVQLAGTPPPVHRGRAGGPALGR